MGTVKPPARLARRIILPSAASPLCRSKVSSSSRVTSTPRQPLTRRDFSSVSSGSFLFGVAVHETHPHILNPGEITPGISAQEYADRRAALAHSLSDGGLAILPAAPVQYKSGAVFFPYRQESNFLWLTGWNEPESICTIEKTGPNLGDYTFRLFVQPKNPKDEQWSGYRNGVRAAEDVFNADEALAIDQAPSTVPRLLESAKTVYADTQLAVKSSGSWMQKFFAGKDTRSKPSSLQPIMNQLRVIKSPAEIINMRKAGQISGRAITSAMKRTWTREKHLHAFLDYEFTINGCEGPAYIPVVAGGEHANCIHYTANDDALKPNDLVLIDAGGEYGSYITDISRTWPIDGKFTKPQRDLYEAVLKVQRTSVSLCRQSSNMSLEDIHRVTVRGLIDQLKDLGFDVSSSNIDQLFPHHVGHYIGLDVHDCPGYSRRELLKDGHCVTIEPGVYVPYDDRWPKHFRGMGIRIEDSICVDEDTPFILSTEAVKEVADIEALRS